MPLQVQRDAHVVDLADGIEIVTGQGTVFLGGNSARRWVTRLLGTVDGKRSLDEILVRAAPPQRAMAERVLSTMLDAGLIREASTDDETSLAPAERERFAAEIEFLGKFVSDPATAFARHRRLSVGVLAPEDYADRLRESFERTGVTEVHTMLAPIDADAVDSLPDVDVVVHAMHAQDPAADAMERRCRATGAALVEVTFDGTTAWWCPLGTVRWSDVRARLRGLGWYDMSQVPNTETSHTATRTVITNMIAQDVFRSAGQDAPRPEQPKVVEFDLDGAERRTHPIRPHPFTRDTQPEAEDTFLRRVAARAEGPALSRQEFSEGAVTLMDSRVGLFTEITQGPMPQLPLKAATAIVADPVGLLPMRIGLPRVTQADLDFPEARRQVGMRAIATYASLMVDPRRLAPASAEFASMAVADPWAAVRELRHGRAKASVRGMDLLARRSVMVDARAVFPALAAITEPYVAPPGVGVGLDWYAAVEDGLLQHCTRLTIAAMAGGRQIFDRVDVHGRKLPARAVRALTMLDGLGHVVEVGDVSHIVGIPALVCVLDSVAVAYGCGSTYEQALEVCLLSTLQADQGCLRPPDIALPGVFGTTRSRPLPESERLTVGEIARRLAAVAGRPVLVPLDHDPEPVAVLPYTVRVVLNEV